MKNLIILFLLISISISCFAEKSINNPNLFMDKIEFFYIDSNPTVAKEIIKEVVDFNYIDNLGGVITAFAREYPNEIVKWISDNHIKFEEHPSVINALETVCELKFLDDSPQH